MTSVAVHGRAPRFVACHAAFHGCGDFFRYHIPFVHRSVAPGAINVRLSMQRVAEEDKILD
jgi:hypothetical protein